MESAQGVRRFVSGRLLATRQGTILVGVAAAALAAIILIAYVNQYRQSLSDGAAQTSVLIASGLIEKGTPGDVVARSRRFQVRSYANDEVKEGALTDPASLTGKQAVADIYPGQQLTLADFSGVSVGLGATLRPRERAISLPVDAVRTMGGVVQPGDHVDIMASIGGGNAPPVVKTVLQDIYVIAPPGASTGGIGETTTSGMTLRVSNRQAEKLAFVIDNGKMWAVLRPRANARRVKTPGASYLNVFRGGG